MINSRTRLFFKFLLSIFFVAIFEIVTIFYIHINDNSRIQTINKTVIVTKLPDLAIYTDARFIRHRSISDSFSQKSEDGAIWNYFNGDFIYAISDSAKSSKELF